MKNYLQAPFLITVIILAAFAGGMSYYKSRYGVNFIKKAIPLKAPFDLLDEKLLKPYKVLDKARIDNKDVLESLGTEEYLQWFVEDTTVNEMSPVRHCSVFITYYTGNPDQVPHVPEACYTGAGSQVQEKFSLDMNIGDVNVPDMPKDGKIPAVGLIFSEKSSDIWQSSAKFPVIYFFKVNGQYKGGRTAVRLALGDLTSEYSYFSKVEIKFYNARGLYPDKEQAIEATGKLLKVLLPVLERYHWPDWNRIE
ncbi:MAG: hypothetical protein PHP01_03490 [Phycisphaerae bacterium]|nr:hypothetical protein [Phycisphaerae bacterium]